MALFETILETSHSRTSKTTVQIDSVEWSSYDYGRPADRANWEINATCAPRPAS